MFQLTVDDGNGANDRDVVAITVGPASTPSPTPTPVPTPTATPPPNPTPTPTPLPDVGPILLIEDQSGFGAAAQVLRNDGFLVDEINFQFDDGYAAFLDASFLAGYPFIVYGERGDDGGALLPQGVADRLEVYIQNGGHLLVTGADTLGSPTDTVLAELVRATSPSDQVSNNPNWTTADRNVFPLVGPIGDFRGLSFSAQGYDDDQLIPDLARGAIELAATPGQTSKIIFTSLLGGGSVGYWNGGLFGTDTEAQPDFTTPGIPQDIFRNWAHGAVRAAPSASGAKGPLNDTGIDFCADDSNNFDFNGTPAEKQASCDSLAATHPEQDGMHGRDARARNGTLAKVGSGAAGFDYIKICNNGQAAGQGGCPADPVLGSAANDWACTRDNVTGLIWEVKVNDPSHLRHTGHRYTWYSTDGSTNGGNPGTQNGGSCSGSDCDTQGYAAAVNAAGLCGANDWRLPMVSELNGLLHWGRSVSPLIDTALFPNTRNLLTWSSSPLADRADLAWSVLFNGGFVGALGKSVGSAVRLVRAGQ